MPRRGENIYKRKDGRWEGRYIKGHVDGKIQYGYVFARTYKDVKNKLLTAQNACSSEVKKVPENSGYAQGDSFSEAAQEWFYSKKIQWKQSSTVKYANILNLYLLPAFADKKIEDISREDVAKFCSQLLKNGGVKEKGLSPKTVSDTVSVLKNIFEYAAQVKGCQITDIKGVSVKQPQNPLRIFSRGEQEKLSQYLYHNLNFCNLGVLVCLYTGLRIGEICALKWEDISFDEQCVYVHQTMQRLQVQNSETKTAVIISAPKSDCSIRKIPIPDNIFRLLKEFRKPDDAFLLTGMANEFIEPRTMQNHFKRVIKHCSIDSANFHTLRHTFATRCVELGFDIKSLSEILGHASVNITLNRYVHPSMELKQKNMNMLSELFSVKK